MDASSRERGPRSRAARILAPVALVATVVAALVIVAGSLGGSDDDDADGGATTTETTEARGCPDNPPADAALENGFYVIKSGENLSTVVERTCMGIEEISALNPDLDPQLLPVGACVNLRPDGCESRLSPEASARAGGRIST